MAKFVVTSTSVTLNSVDVSASCARAELSINASEVETTDFGSAGYVEVIGGLKSGTVSLDFHSDFGVGGVSETFEDLIGTVIPIVLIAGNGTTASATTPSYSFNALVTSFTPVSGAVGDLATFSVSFPTSGAITVATS
tara:strand:+ start:316 stop:729 length:414 start_codon:yes stop_codon:yes gene_type:complete